MSIVSVLGGLFRGGLFGGTGRLILTEGGPGLEVYSGTGVSDAERDGSTMGVRARHPAGEFAVQPAEEGKVRGDIVINTCCRYQMYGEFLVDGETGDVWKYDDQKKKFVEAEKEAEKEDDHLRKLRDVIAGYEVMDKMRGAKPKIAGEVHYSEIEKYENVIDATVKVLDAKVGKLLKEIKP